MQKINLLFMMIYVLYIPLLLAMDEKQAQIVVVRSTCSSGKTTLCEEFIKQNDDWEVVDEDAICMNACPLIIEKYCPQEYALLKQYIAPENMFHAICRREIIYISNVQESSNERVVTAIRAIEKILNDRDSIPAKEFHEEYSATINHIRNQAIKKILHKNKNVILDSWMKDTHYYKEQFKDTKCSSVLAYCPLQKAYALFNKRNAKAKEQGLVRVGRFYGQLIFSYVGCYTLTESPSEHTVDTCCPQEIDQIFSDMESRVVQDWQEAKQAFFSRREMNLYHLMQQRKLFLPDEIKKKEVAYISPKESCDYVVHTGVTPETSAQDLLNKLYNEKQT